MPELTTLGELLAATSEPFETRSELTRSNKRMPALLTTADGQLACAIPITAMPAAFVGVCFNGVMQSDLGDGTRALASCYFSRDGGATALFWSEVTLGDLLYWQGTVAMHECAPSDVFDFVYEEG
jgi:hypothetical protein